MSSTNYAKKQLEELCAECCLSAPGKNMHELKSSSWNMTRSTKGSRIPRVPEDSENLPGATTTSMTVMELDEARLELCKLELREKRRRVGTSRGWQKSQPKRMKLHTNTPWSWRSKSVKQRIRSELLEMCIPTSQTAGNPP